MTNTKSHITLYHGSDKVVERPKIIINKTRMLDFGTGFYTTTSLVQAQRWVKIRANRDSSFGKGAISKYSLNVDIFTESNLKWKKFSSEDLDKWFDFIMDNRHNSDFSHSYDLVSGPVANDNVYRVLSLFEDGFIDKETAIKDLKTYTLWDQFLFHTDPALNALKFCGEVK